MTTLVNPFMSHPAVGGGGDVTDDFNRADSASSLGTSSSGHLWVAPTGTWGIASNKAYAPSASDGQVAYIDAGITDVLVTATVSGLTGGGYAGLIARAPDSDNFYLNQFGSDAERGRLWRCVGGSFTPLTSPAGGTTPDGAVYALRVVGSSIKAYYNGAEILSVTDSTHTSGTYAGLRLGALSAPRWDDFSIVAAP